MRLPPLRPEWWPVLQHRNVLRSRAMKGWRRMKASLVGTVVLFAVCLAPSMAMAQCHCHHAVATPVVVPVVTPAPPVVTYYPPAVAYVVPARVSYSPVVPAAVYYAPAPRSLPRRGTRSLRAASAVL